MIGDKQAKYRNIHDATHCNDNASLKSEKYHGFFRFKSFIKPPNIRPVLDKPDSSRSLCSSCSSLISSFFGFSGGRLRSCWDGTAAGGSMRIVGSHSPGGSTVTASRNSSIPARRWSRLRARYATSWNISSDISVAIARPISWKLPLLPGGPSSMNRNLWKIEYRKMFYFIATISIGDVENLIIPLSLHLLSAMIVVSNCINFVLIGEIPHPFLTQFRINKYIKLAPVLYSSVFFRYTTNRRKWICPVSMYIHGKRQQLYVLTSFENCVTLSSFLWKKLYFDSWEKPNSFQFSLYCWCWLSRWLHTFTRLHCPWLCQCFMEEIWK